MEDQEEEMVEVEEEVVRGDPRCRRALCTEVAPENTCMIPPVLTVRQRPKFGELERVSSTE